MAPNPDRRKPPRRRLLTISDIAVVCGVGRDTARMWDWTGQLPAPDASTGIQKPNSRGWEPETLWSQWCQPIREMTREEFDAGIARLSDSPT